MTVWITEIHSGQLMAIPTYWDTNITNSSSFSWSGSQWTTYQTRHIGTTINDSGGCGWNGSHVHETHVAHLTGLVAITRNTSLYTKDGSGCSDTNCCPTPANPNMTCGTFKNNDISKWIRRFAWDEGICPHAPSPCP